MKPYASGAAKINTTSAASRGLCDVDLGVCTCCARPIARQEPIIALIPFSDASYDPIRATPRFAAIVRQLGLDVALFTSPNGGRPR